MRPDDIHFAQAVANVLAMAVEREVADRERADLLARERAARDEAALAIWNARLHEQLRA